MAVVKQWVVASEIMWLQGLQIFIIIYIFIDGWGQCDFRFTNFGVIMEYLESRNSTERRMVLYLVFFVRMPFQHMVLALIQCTLLWWQHEHEVAKQPHVKVRWPGKARIHHDDRCLSSLYCDLACRCTCCSSILSMV